ncbi:NAD-dependent malate dehydrogenase [Haematococcus lacustris]
MLGPDQPVILHLLDIEPSQNALNGVRMELIDAAYPLLQAVHTFTSVEAAAKGVHVAVMVGGYPRKAGEERKDVMAKNVSIYKSQASALAQHAAKGVKIVVVANPANTNALILRENAPGIPAENITCLTRLDHNRAVGQVSERTGTHNTEVRNVIIWGNHSSTQYPDVNHGTVKGQPIRQAVADDAWLNSEFITTVQQRGAAIIKARGLSSALSAASSVCDHVRDWVLGTPCGRWVSMGVVSDGSYGVAPGLVFSYPVKCSGGKWSIVQGLKLDPASKALLAATEAELLEEKELASQCLAGK